MLQIFITNLGRYNEGILQGKWLTLPADNEEISNALLEIGIDEEYEEYFIADSETDIEGLSDIISEYENLKTLNEIAELLDELDRIELDKVEAVLEYESISLSDIKALLERLDDYILYQDIEDNESLGQYLIEEMNFLEIPTSLEPYFNYESYGRDYNLNSNGCFTSKGYLEYIK